MKCIPVLQSQISISITLVFNVTQSFRNHSNMMVWFSVITNSYCLCSDIINSSYYQCWKESLLLNNILVVNYPLFPRILLCITVSTWKLNIKSTYLNHFWRNIWHWRLKWKKCYIFYFFYHNRDKLKCIIIENC